MFDIILMPIFFISLQNMYKFSIKSIRDIYM